MISSPFEQFEVVSLLGIVLGSSNLVLIISCSVIVGMLGSVGSNRIVGSGSQVIVEGIVKQLMLMLKECLGSVGSRYLGIVTSLFLLIVTLNVVGMVPYSYTVTGQLVVCLVLSLGIWIGKVVLGIRRHGIRLLGMFIPAGVPFGMVPFFIVIEVIGFVVPVISLSVRLFANMMSGHVLMKVLVGFIWIMLSNGSLLGIVQGMPLVVMLCLIGLEVFVCLIQAYVFTLLCCIYLNDMEVGSH